MPYYDTEYCTDSKKCSSEDRDPTYPTGRKLILTPFPTAAFARASLSIHPPHR
jgi:hypothetical protein